MITAETLLLILLPAVTFLCGLWAWQKYGRDPKGGGIIVPQYNSPDKLSPAEVGVLYDYKSTDREVTATILDLTLRGYMRIHQVEGEGLLGKEYSYVFELLRDDVLDLKKHEQEILDGLFGVVSTIQTAEVQKSVTNPKAKHEIQSQYAPSTKSLVGTVVSLNDIRPYFYTKVTAMHECLYETLTIAGYFPYNPLYSSISAPVLSILLLCVAIAVRGRYGISIGLSALPLILFSFIMKTRSQKGQLTKEYIDGFRMYLKTAEKDRLAVLQEPNNSELDNLDTVRLYEHFLPYAVALGLERAWTSQFQDVYSEKPEWFNSLSGTFDIQHITNIAGEVKQLLVQSAA